MKAYRIIDTFHPSSSAIVFAQSPAEAMRQAVRQVPWLAGVPVSRLTWERESAMDRTETTEEER